MSVRLREYQLDGMEDIREAFTRVRRVLYVSPTGSGKTTLFSAISAGVYKKQKRVLILAHRRELLKQISESLRQFGVPHALLTAGRLGIPRANVVVASVFTLARRLKRFPAPDLIIGDEAHHFTPETTWGKVVANFSEAKVLGVTATAVRGDARGLGDVFDELVVGLSVLELTSMGFLTPAEVYAPAKPDLSGVHHRAGDYVVSELEAVMDKPFVTGSAVDHYRKYAHGKRAVVFACSIKHAKDVAAQFREAGYRSEHVDGEMDERTRDKVIDDFRSGRVQVMTSCSLVQEGFDCPAIEVAILLRPTESLGLYLQMVGRAIRTAPGKSKTTVLDHAGLTQKFGFIDDPREWSLRGTADKKQSASDAPAVRVCPACYAAHRPSHVCPRCGHVYEVRGRKVKHVDGDLVQVSSAADYAAPGGAGANAAKGAPGDDLERLYYIMLNVAKRRGHENPPKFAIDFVSTRLAQRMMRGALNERRAGEYQVELDDLRRRTIDRAMSKESVV